MLDMTKNITRLDFDLCGIYTVGFYLGLYTSLKDKIQANDSNFQKNEDLPEFRAFFIFLINRQT